MWHDPWPPLPPGGHRPPDTPPFTSPGDQLLAVGLGAATGAGALVWASGQAAGLAAHNGPLAEPAAELDRCLAFNPEHQDAPLGRPRFVVANPLA